MKKFLMTLVVAVMAISANAQFYVGGGVGFSTSGDGDDNVSSFKFLPEVGYNFNDEWAAGITLGWEGHDKGLPKQWTIAPYARYTFVKGKVASVFVDGGIGYGHTYNSGLDRDALTIGFKPGVAVNLNDRLSFVTHFGFIGYDHTKDNNTKAKWDEWGVDIDGNNIVFGIYYSL